jgi:hypothetical protein
MKKREVECRSEGGQGTKQSRQTSPIYPDIAIRLSMSRNAPAIVSSDLNLPVSIVLYRHWTEPISTRRTRLISKDHCNVQLSHGTLEQFVGQILQGGLLSINPVQRM